MPLYEYSCKSCGKKLELMRSINDQSKVLCPDCKSECQKLVSTTSFQLKGTGWYKTDYCSSNNNSVNSPKTSVQSTASCSGCCNTTDGCKA
jgi:putative FmdB family regulatory protein